MQLVQLADCCECYCLMVDDGYTWCNLFCVRRLSRYFAPERAVGGGGGVF